MQARWRVSLFAAIFVGVVSILSGCGGGGGGSDGSLPGGGWVTITMPTTEPSFVDDCNEAYLFGEAFISPDWFAVGDTVATGVTVTWYNAGTGSGGQAAQRASICYLFGTPTPCNHVWWATIPLVVGSNEITVTATDPDGRIGTDVITIGHPETSYSLSGRVATGDGFGLAFRDSQIDLELSDGSVTRRTVTSIDGSYRFSCARSGVTYEITPSSPVSYGFEPAQRQVVSPGADVEDLDFSTEAWFLSGRVLRENDSGVSGIMIHVTGNDSDTDISQLTDDSGIYRLALPNGIYTIQAYDFFGVYTVSPSGWVGDTVISGADLGDRDFLATD